jgi:predicted permease
MAPVLALLVVSLVAGAIARRLAASPPETPRAVNAIVLNVALPALIIRVMHEVRLSPELAVGAAMLWLQFLAAAGLFLLIGWRLGLPRGTVGALTLTGGLSNTAFIGLPVIEMALGRDALGVAVFVDQLGSFLVMATLGLVAAAAFSGRSVDAKTVATRLIRFPPFLALALALALRPVAFPEWVSLTLDRLGALLTPLALFSVGFQLQLRGLSARTGTLAAGLGYKLLLSPLLAAAALWATGQVEPGTLAWKVTILQCAMPPMVTGGILATEYDCDPPLAAAMVGIGLPVSAVTLAIALALLG